jgi:VWFA-related protein
MSVFNLFTKLCFPIIILCSSLATFAQDEKKTPELSDIQAETPDDDLLRISSDLIQTGVAVFDKKGQFVSNLKKEDFELRVDGKPIPISFFESFAPGNANDKTKPSPEGRRTAQLKGSFAGSVFQGRVVIFVVDDLHLSMDSHKRTRDLINKFINQEMIPGDTVAVVSTTGKIGFLQQFTDDKTVLRAAVQRLIFNRDYTVIDRSPPPMNEYEALLISQFDSEVTEIFAAQEGSGSIEAKIEAVRSRARVLLSQAEAINRRTYSTLEQAIRSSASLPGRKIVFFISDGFLLNPSNTDASYRLQRITDAAARTNAVIYSFDAKGLDAGFPEGTTASGSNRGLGFRVQGGQRFEVQDGLSELADSTGGRFTKNTNDLQTGLTKVLEDASLFYLLAWEPESENSKQEKLKRIEVTVKNRPELKVRMQTGYLEPRRTNENKTEKTSAKKEKTEQPNQKTAQTSLSLVERELIAAVVGQFPLRALPASLAVNYLDMPGEGSLIAAAVKIDIDSESFTQEADKRTASIDLLGIIYDSDGKRIEYFRELLKIDASAAKLDKSSRPSIYYNYRAKLKPGLYQMRVAARDVKSGRTGTAVQWIEIPDLSSRRLALSSLLLSEQTGDGKQLQTGSTFETIFADTGISVDRSFVLSSRLQYLVFIYNASRGRNGQAKPDITLQTQVFRRNSLVIESPTRQVSTEGHDPARIPYAAEIPLNALIPGRYELLVIVRDQTAKTNTEQRISFEVK